MTLRSRFNTMFAVAAAAFVVATSASAGSIVVVRDVSARDAAVTGAPAPMQVVRDVSARDARRVAPASQIAVVRDVAARDARASLAGDAASTQAENNGRATTTFAASSLGATSGTDVRAVRAGGFDWIDAGVGASSVILLTILVAGSLLAARHLRSGPLPH